MSNTELASNLSDEAGSTLEEAPAKRGRATKTSGRVKIVLEDNDDIPPTGLPLAHNGNAYVIKPGEPVDVPEFILGILDDAVMSMPITDPQTRQVVGHRDRLRFPYRRV